MSYRSCKRLVWACTDLYVFPVFWIDASRDPVLGCVVYHRAWNADINQLLHLFGSNYIYFPLPTLWNCPWGFFKVALISFFNSSLCEILQPQSFVNFFTSHNHIRTNANSVCLPCCQGNCNHIALNGLPRGTDSGWRFLRSPSTLRLAGNCSPSELLISCAGSSFPAGFEPCVFAALRTTLNWQAPLFVELKATCAQKPPVYKNTDLCLARANHW